MNNKYKIFILFLVGVLGFVGFRGWVFIKEIYLPAVADVSTEKKIASFDTDLDNDGLSDLEESFYKTDFRDPDTDGDGYLDGEELASGYDPRIPAPDDVKPGVISKAASDINLTKRLAGRLYASVDQGEINIDNLEMNDLAIMDDTLDSIAYNTTLESIPVFYTDNVDESEIIILYEPTSEDIQGYTNELFLIINDQLLPKFIYQIYRLEELIMTFDEQEYAFRNEAQYYLPQIEGAINELLSLRVPKIWIPHHMNVIGILRNFESAYAALEVSDNDMMKAIVAAQKIAELNIEFDNVFAGLILFTDELNLDIPDLLLIQLYKNSLY